MMNMIMIIIMIIFLMTMMVHLPPSTAGHHATGQIYEDYDEDYHYYYYNHYDYTTDHDDC